MRREFIRLASVAVIMASPIAAHAADFGGYNGSVKDTYVPTPPPFTWSGAYFGGHIGGGWGDSDLRENLPGLAIDGVEFLPGSLDQSFDIDGFAGGVHLGVRRQYGVWVVGGEINLTGADIDGSTDNCAGGSRELSDFPAGGDTLAYNTNCATSINWMASALFKLGYAWQRWHVFGSVGPAIAGVDHAVTLDADGSIGGTDFDASAAWAENEVAYGVAYGGGVEYAATNDIVFGVEYTRFDLEADGSGLALGGALTTGERDIDLNVVKATLSVKLNGPN